jgi:hypothetical protein
MRGGSIPVLAWGTLLLILMAINWVWSGRAIQVATFGFAVLAVYGFAVAFFVLHRGSIRRGPPEPETEPVAIPELSLGSVAIGISIATILFGFVWAQFLVYFGAGLLVVSLGRLVVELRSERRSLTATRHGQERRIQSSPEEGGIVTPGGRERDGTAPSDTEGRSRHLEARDQV